MLMVVPDQGVRARPTNNFTKDTIYNINGSYKHEYCQGSPVSNTHGLLQDCLDSTHACNSQRLMESDGTHIREKNFIYVKQIIHFLKTKSKSS